MSITSDIGNMISGAVQGIESAAMTALEAEFAPLEIAQAVTNLATQALGQALQSALQQLQGQGGQGGGIPAFLVKDLQKLLNDVMQQLTNPSNPSTNDYVNQQAGGQINNLAQSFVSSILQQMLKDAQSNNGDGSSSTGGSSGTSGSSGTGGSGNWLEALAKALGDKLDQKAQQLQQEANSADGSSPGQMTQLQADSQLFTLMMNAFNNVIKSFGEGLAKMADKQ
jgi:hypothetical protein